MRPNQRGFTLVEMMVALLVGAVSVVVAAKVAQVIIRQSAQGQQSTDFNTRRRLLGRQLRNDLQSAGYGSTGAIAVQPGVVPWTSLAIPVNGKDAVPAVIGTNNIGTVGVGGGTNTQTGSDAVMMVVPNARLSGTTVGFTPRGQNVINLDVGVAGQPITTCATGYVYVVDHTAPNGAGRTQLMRLASAVGNVVTTNDTLQFTLAPQSTVSCARISTYWLDATGWLHRTDFSPVPTLVPLGGGVFVDSSNVGNDLVAPGLLDLQIAYRFSSEIYVAASEPLPAEADLPAQWAFEGAAGNIDPALVPGVLANWFEVRRVRLNMLVRTLRPVDPKTYLSVKTRQPREDGVAINFDQSTRAEWTTTVETLTNLRFFDRGAPQGVSPQPF